MRRIVLALIHGYQLALSPWFGYQCRFFPTCSEYARQAVERYGVLKGLGLTIARVSKCHPWHAGGADPVP